MAPYRRFAHSFQALLTLFVFIKNFDHCFGTCPDETLIHEFQAEYNTAMEGRGGQSSEWPEVQTEGLGARVSVDTSKPMDLTLLVLMDPDGTHQDAVKEMLKILWTKSVWHTFWQPFFDGCKKDELEPWFQTIANGWQTGPAVASAAAEAPTTPTTPAMAAQAAWQSAKAIVTRWADTGKAECQEDTYTPVAAKRSYIEELAEFYYDEEVEEARKSRSWFILNAEKRRAARAAAHDSMYADELLYDFYENVNAETRRERDAYDRLQR
eukprot:925589_1